MWEDPANVDGKLINASSLSISTKMSGGTLMIRLKKNYLDYCWEALVRYTSFLPVHTRV